MEKEIIYKAREILGLNEYQKIGPDKMREVFYGDMNLIGSVSMDEGTISSANSNKPIIATFGLGPCIALVGYEKKSKIGFISHNIPIKKLENLNGPIFETLDELKVKKENLEFYLVGGNEKNKEHLDKIKKYLESKIKYPNIIYEDVIESYDPKNMGKSFVLDTRNQKIYCLNGIMSPDKAENIFSGNMEEYIKELK